MPRSVLTTALVALALAVPSLAFATPAEAGWSRPGELVKYRVCRTSVAGGDAWVFTSRVRKYARTPDARAALSARSGRHRVARWGTGWLDRGEVEISRVRVAKSPKVRILVTQEAGDRDSDIGTSAETRELRPRRIARCG